MLQHSSCRQANGSACLQTTSEQWPPSLEPPLSASNPTLPSDQSDLTLRPAMHKRKPLTQMYLDFGQAGSFWQVKLFLQTNLSHITKRKLQSIYHFKQHCLPPRNAVCKQFLDSFDETQISWNFPATGRMNDMCKICILQATFSYTRCKQCGMMYASGQPADEELHAVFHKKSLRGVTFQVKLAPIVFDTRPRYLQPCLITAGRFNCQFYILPHFVYHPV